MSSFSMIFDSIKHVLHTERNEYEVQLNHLQYEVQLNHLQAFFFLCFFFCCLFVFFCRIHQTHLCLCSKWHCEYKQYDIPISKASYIIVTIVKKKKMQKHFWGDQRDAQDTWIWQYGSMAGCWHLSSFHRCFYALKISIISVSPKCQASNKPSFKKVIEIRCI